MKSIKFTAAILASAMIFTSCSTGEDPQITNSESGESSNITSDFSSAPESSYSETAPETHIEFTDVTTADFETSAGESEPPEDTAAPTENTQPSASETDSPSNTASVSPPSPASSGTEAATEPPKTNPPKTEPPKTTPPQTEAPKTEAPKTEAPETEAPKPNPVPDKNMTVSEVIADMGLGINLGNTMEACGDWINSSGGVKAYETAWGSPVITENIIKGYAKSGFGVLRIPVAWSNLMGDDYTINADLMARVKQITEWTTKSGMYAIVNIHWDSGWWEKFPTNKAECMKKYTRIWQQICEEFKDFDSKVMFESLNEEGGWDSMWNRYSGAGDKKGSYGLLNEINQKFVDTVRASGGNNAARCLLIAGYNTDIDLTCDPLFKMPNDPQNRCAVSVHYYTPSTFCLLREDADWGKLQTTWGSDSDVEQLVKNMDKMKETFVDKGVPVIIGEFSVCEKDVKEVESVHRFITSVIKEATQRKMCPVLWDVTGDYYDRTNCKFIDQDLLKEMMAAKAD